MVNFRSQAELLLYVEQQMKRAEEVVLVYEAGPLGYGLYRALKARGVRCYVCAPDSREQQRKRRKNNAIDTRSLTSNLFNYLNGNEPALPTGANTHDAGASTFGQSATRSAG